MESSIFDAIGIDPGIILIFVLGVLLIVLVYMIKISMKMSRFIKKYKMFMRGLDGASLERAFAARFNQMDLLEENKDTFVGLAGLDVEYDPSKPEGERYLSIKFGGKEIAPVDEFIAASVKGAVKSLPVVKSYDELVFRDMFISYLDSLGGEISGAPQSLKIVK